MVELQTPENIKNNTVLLKNESGRPVGTGFFLKNRYCVTSYSNLSSLKSSTIIVNKNERDYDGKLDETLSDKENEIAIIEVPNAEFEYLQTYSQTLPSASVYICGYAIQKDRWELHFVQAKLGAGNATIFNQDRIIESFYFSEIYGTIQQIQCGAPVCNSTDNRIIGMMIGNYFDYFEDTPGQYFVVPIESILARLKPSGFRFNVELKPLHVGDTSISKILDIGNNYFFNGKYTEALNYYSEVLTRPEYRKNHMLWNNKGLVFLKLSKYENAIESFDNAIKLLPNSTTALYNKGIALAFLAKFQEAIYCYDKALEINPDASEVWNDKGGAFLGLGKYRDAIYSFDKALSLDPSNFVAWVNKGNSLRNVGMYDESIKAFEEAIQINNNYSLGWMGKGASLKDIGKYEEAIECYSKAIKISPSVDAWYNLGTMYSELERNDQAIESFKKALQLDSNFLDGWHGLGVLYSKLEKYGMSIDSFNKALQLNPNSSAIWYQLGVAKSNMGKQDEALEAYDRVLKIDPRHAAAYYAKGIILQTRKPDEAKIYLQKARELGLAV